MQDSMNATVDRPRYPAYLAGVQPPFTSIARNPARAGESPDRCHEAMPEGQTNDPVSDAY
jgi:hypothetical protein